MRIRLTRHVTIDIDEQLRENVVLAVERFRTDVRGYLRSAVDDIDTAGARVRRLGEAAVTRFDSAVTRVNDRISPEDTESFADERRVP